MSHGFSERRYSNTFQYDLATQRWAQVSGLHAPARNAQPMPPQVMQFLAPAGGGPQGISSHRLPCARLPEWAHGMHARRWRGGPMSTTRPSPIPAAWLPRPLPFLAAPQARQGTGQGRSAACLLCMVRSAWHSRFDAQRAPALPATAASCFIGNFCSPAAANLVLLQAGACRTASRGGPALLAMCGSCPLTPMCEAAGRGGRTGPLRARAAAWPAYHPPTR